MKRPEPELISNKWRWEANSRELSLGKPFPLQGGTGEMGYTDRTVHFAHC